MHNGTVHRMVTAIAAAGVLATACSPPSPQSNGYKSGIEPGMTQAQAEALLGKPKDKGPFNLAKLTAYILTYPFGQLLLEHGAVVTITVTDDPSYVGPFGITLGMPEDAMKAAFATHKAKRTGHKDSYDVVVGTNDTRSRDYYDQTDHLMIELAAANPNDPLAPFNVISITRANDAGLALLSAVTQAKLGGLYPDQHVFNYTSVPWSM